MNEKKWIVSRLDSVYYSYTERNTVEGFNRMNNPLLIDAWMAIIDMINEGSAIQFCIVVYNFHLMYYSRFSIASEIPTSESWDDALRPPFPKNRRTERPNDPTLTQTATAVVLVSPGERMPRAWVAVEVSEQPWILYGFSWPAFDTFPFSLPVFQRSFLVTVPRGVSLALVGNNQWVTGRREGGERER